MPGLMKLGLSLYRTDNSRELRRLLVFWVRSFLHRGKMRALFDFFEATPVRQRLGEINPVFFEQVTRQFFYKQSTFEQRLCLIKEHVQFLENCLPAQVLWDIYDDQPLILWQEKYKESSLSFQLGFEPGQKKEGMLALSLNLGLRKLYQIIFWIAPEPSSGARALWIGAMQGPNGQDAVDVIKEITKHFYAYRTKNLILYGVRALARSLGLTVIYAVTNEGYYANNHLRINRKLKTSFGDFWAEAGGVPCEDNRYYRLELREYRKSMEEVKTHKRNLYRNRFAYLDRIDEGIETVLGELQEQRQVLLGKKTDGL